MDQSHWLRHTKRVKMRRSARLILMAIIQIAEDQGGKGVARTTIDSIVAVARGHNRCTVTPPDTIFDILCLELGNWIERDVSQGIPVYRVLPPEGAWPLVSVKAMKKKIGPTGGLFDGIT